MLWFSPLLIFRVEASRQIGVDIKGDGIGFNEATGTIDAEVIRLIWMLMIHNGHKGEMKRNEKEADNCYVSNTKKSVAGGFIFGFTVDFIFCFYCVIFYFGATRILELWT